MVRRYLLTMNSSLTDLVTDTQTSTLSKTQLSPECRFTRGYISPFFVKLLPPPSHLQSPYQANTYLCSLSVTELTIVTGRYLIGCQTSKEVAFMSYELARGQTPETKGGDRNAWEWRAANEEQLFIDYRPQEGDRSRLAQRQGECEWRCGGRVEWQWKANGAHRSSGKSYILFLLLQSGHSVYFVACSSLVQLYRWFNPLDLKSTKSFYQSNFYCGSTMSLLSFKL